MVLECYPNLDTSNNCAEVEMRLVRVVFLISVPCQPHVEDDQWHNDQDCILLAMSNQANSVLEH